MKMTIENQRKQLEKLHEELLKISSFKEKYEIEINKENEIEITSDNEKYYIEISCYHKNEYLYNIVNMFANEDFADIDEETIIEYFYSII